MGVTALLALSGLSVCLGDGFGGFYVDPNHHRAGSFAGTRFISDELGLSRSTTLTLVGSDDGLAFWTLSGAWTDQAAGVLTVDFSPKGGPSNLTGVWSAGVITWQDRNRWTRLGELGDTTADETSGPSAIGGYYLDPPVAKGRSGFAGIRMVSDLQGDLPGDVLTFVGSDDGANFWSVRGKWLQKDQGKFIVDFSPKGGPKDLQGTFWSGKIFWADGNAWSRQAIARQVAA